MGLKDKFQIAGCLDEPVHVLEQLLRGYARVYLGGLYVGVSPLVSLSLLAVLVLRRRKGEHHD